MTVLELVETLQETFPDVSLRECLKKMSVAQREFAAVTKCLVGYVDIAVGDISGGLYQLDPEIHLVRSVEFIDSNAAVVETDFIYNISEHCIHLFSSTGEILSTLPSSAAYMRMRCVFLPDSIAETAAALEEQPTVHERFHMALVWGAMVELALLKGRPDLVKAAQAKFNYFVIEGMKYANRESNDAYDIRWRLHYVDTATTVPGNLDTTDE